jgi:amidophosphoribosyltransferase
MCGIAAVYTPSSIKEKIFFLIKSLQHRGQDSYGYSDGYIVEKYLGMIEHPPKKINKNIALAHTRYRTSGEVELNLGQPLKKNEITLVHNGNVNLKFETTDSEALLDYMIINKKENIIDTIKNVIENIEGSFFIILIYKEILYAFKDKQGIRPGLYGINSNGDVIISSENNQFPYVNIDINPGEIIEVKEGKINKYQKNYNENLSPCIFEYIYFSHPESTLYGLNVRDFRIKMAENCSKIINSNIDIVCGVPNSSRIYGLEIARLLKKNYIEPYVKKKRSFILPTQEERENYVKEKFVFKDNAFKYDHVLIVDDSVVRGTTSKHLISLFKEKGCTVTFLSCSPKIINVNKFGINISTKKELVSYKIIDSLLEEIKERSLEEISKYLGCKEIIYPSIDDLFDCSGFKNLELSIFKK